MPDNARESAQAMTLVRRAYLYSLFHLVFGGRPTAKSTSQAFSEETLTMFGYMREVLAQEGYEHIAARLVGASGRSLSACADDAFTCIKKTRENVSNPAFFEAFAETLRVDYDKLFQVPGDTYVHLWESPYTGVESMVFQESTLDVRSFYHDAGFKLRAEKRFPDDHIAAMMNYMAAMAQRAYEAYADGLDNEVCSLLATQHLFAMRHILTWVDLFASKVIENDAHAYFGAFAGGMAAFVRVDVEMIERLESQLAKR